MPQRSERLAGQAPTSPTLSLLNPELTTARPYYPSTFTGFEGASGGFATSRSLLQSAQQQSLARMRQEGRAFANSVDDMSLQTDNADSISAALQL